MSEGWICVHRCIRDHWIWEDATKLKWWLDILLSANHTDKKILLDGNPILIKRGSFHTSIYKLSDRWKVDRKTVRRFLDGLEKEQMVVIKKSFKGTTLEVCNYETYQGFLSKPKDYDRDYGKDYSKDYDRDYGLPPNNNDNNLNNSNNETTTTIGDGFNIYKYAQERGFAFLSPINIQNLQADIEIYSLEEVKKAIDIADDNGVHKYSYVRSVLERRRAGVNEKADKQAEFEKGMKAFLESDEF